MVGVDVVLVSEAVVLGGVDENADVTGRRIFERLVDDVNLEVVVVVVELVVGDQVGVDELGEEVVVVETVGVSFGCSRERFSGRLSSLLELPVFRDRPRWTRVKGS